MAICYNCRASAAAIRGVCPTCGTKDFHLDLKPKSGPTKKEREAQVLAAMESEFSDDKTIEKINEKLREREILRREALDRKGKQSRPQKKRKGFFARFKARAESRIDSVTADGEKFFNAERMSAINESMSDAWYLNCGHQTLVGGLGNAVMRSISGIESSYKGNKAWCEVCQAERTITSRVHRSRPRGDINPDV
jgi:predicted  nucleic acid-binding Zn-ribbon protein